MTKDISDLVNEYMPTKFIIPVAKISVVWSSQITLFTFFLLMFLILEIMFQFYIEIFKTLLVTVCCLFLFYAFDLFDLTNFKPILTF
mmetsp:Transcript_32563/g.28828  ORF Transcript_32563/g.28828 Transcript_32563/m.28828 type:complete len:87 (-) Transcript_32563:7-267(-)